MHCVSPSTLVFLFITVDLSHEYEQEVARVFIRAYGEGKTPNPDVLCNSRIKFGAFFDWAREQDFDFVATGHYARTSEENVLQEGQGLFAGYDPKKDQSYFLWAVPREQFRHILFPVGAFEKREVRERALRAELPVAEKKDSQGVCFLGPLDMKTFLGHYLPLEKGAVLDEVGKEVGEHDGALLYTLGQRHGFTVPRTRPDAPPLFVVAKDVLRNTITVAEHPTEKQGCVTTVHLSDCAVFEELKKEGKYTARFRHRQTRVPLASLSLEKGGAQVIFAEPQAFVASGQSLVVYEGEQVVLGGVIV
jgi:tRNA-specific 2-thiouridylase